MIFSVPCPHCCKYRESMGLSFDDRHSYWQQNLLAQNPKWRHPTKFGKEYHKMALRKLKED
jgi:hypothetical protein